MAMEKREQVFISSTFKDLIDERREVIQTLLEANCIPSGMELFPASDDEKFDLIKRVIDLCDYYIVIVGGRYGSVDDQEQLSYTEMEFEYAVKTKKPVMAFLHGDPGKIPADKSEMDPDLRLKLDAFRDKLGERMVKYWHSPAELGGAVAKSLIQIRNSHPAEGWIRASNALTPEVETELAELRQKVAELTNELNERKRQHRVEDTEHLAQGEDTFELDVFVEYHTKENVEAGTAFESRRQRARGPYDVTWNELFAYIGPCMLNEASEKKVTEEVAFLAYKLAEAEPDRIPDFGELMEADVSGDCFDDIKVQLYALGLIEKSDRKRPVADKSTYWRLTDYGHETLMRLRAIRRANTDDTSSSTSHDTLQEVD